MKRTLLSITLSISLSVVLAVGAVLSVACTKQDLIRNAGFVVTAAQKAAPLVKQILPASAIAFDEILPITVKLKDAIAKDDATNAVLFLSQIIPTFDDIVSHDIPQLSASDQVIILAALSLADIGLSFLSNYYSSQPALQAIHGAPGAGPDQIKSFAAKRVWGKDFQK